MSAFPQAEIEAMLAEEFDRQGWDYQLGIARALAGALRAGEPVDTARLARQVSSTDLARVGVSRGDLEAALADAVGGHEVSAEPAAKAVTVTINNQSYQVNMSGHAKIEGSNLNLGGTLVNVDVDVDASRGDVLAGMEALIRAGLAGDWDPAAAAAIAAVIDERGDVSAEDLSELTREVGTAERAEPGPVRSFLEKVAIGASTSTVAAGLTSGLAHLLAHPPL